MGQEKPASCQSESCGSMKDWSKHDVYRLQPSDRYAFLHLQLLLFRDYDRFVWQGHETPM